jgi:peptidoglycan/LPS O-acetylase OafA/YrhL
VTSRGLSTAAPPDLQHATRRARRLRFRGDIEGMRAVAVLLVVAYHAGVPFVSGGFVGVDVFFVLSGFLITGLLVDELRRTGRISLGDFYARRVRRLLPLATLVLAATAVATVLLVPPIDRAGVGVDVVAASLWAANWRYALQATQYMADTEKSPVLHYWSLSVEEQFYVVWPLLILLLVGTSGLALRAWPVVVRRLALALGLVAVVSLLLSWQQTASGSTFAYYGLHTRSWELAAGGLLALARPALHLLTRRAAVGAVTLGGVLVVGSALSMTEQTPFPGLAAVVPVLGTVLLVAGGVRANDTGLSALLSHAWPRFVGRVSYAWYLWHWPCITIVNDRWPQDPTATGGGRAAPWAVALAVALSLVLAVASHYVVEQPLRVAGPLKASRRRSLALGAALVTVSLVSACSVAVGGRDAADEPVVAVQVAATPGAPSASATSGSSATSTASRAARSAAPAPQPAEPRTPAGARDNLPPDGDDCYENYEGTNVPPLASCRLGPADGKVSLALIGDSHAQQWRPALEVLAKERGWTVHVFAKSSCTVTDVPVLLKQQKARYAACEQWRARMLERVSTIEGLDAVVVGRWKDYQELALDAGGALVAPQAVGDVWADGFARSVAALRGAAPRVVVMADVPRPGDDVPSCLSAGEGPAECGFPREDHTHLDGVLLEAEKRAGKGVRVVDLTPVICPAATCPVVTSRGQIMYRDSHHLTAGYAATLAPQLRTALEAALR